MTTPKPPDAPDRLPYLQPCASPPASASWNLAHSRPFFCRLSVQPEHISGVVEHVSNVEYVRWLDRAAELHSDSLGYTRHQMLSHNMMWFVARHEIDYLAEAVPGDELVIATWVRDAAKVKSWRDYVIMRPADNTVIARAATLWVLVALPSRRPMRIPAVMAERFDPLLPPASASPALA